MSRAFDSLLPEFFCAKLHTIGIWGVILQWIHSFLTNRKLKVLLRGGESRDGSVEMGVPQGSILGPLIFLLFINDLPERLRDAHVVMYADDTSIAVADDDPERIEQRVSAICRDFVAWCRANRIMANESKTVYLNFHLRRALPPGVLTTINFEECCKFLGVVVDQHLSFVGHIESLCKKLNTSYFALMKLRNCLSTSGLLEAYYALCYSHMSYNILIWGRAPQWTRVFISQKRLLRLIFSLDHRESCRPIFESHNLLTLPSIYILKAVTYVHKNFNKFEKLQHGYSTRNGENLVTASHASTFFERSPQFDFVRVYNKLPLSIRSSKSITGFKTITKRLLLSRTYYSYQDYLDDNL